MALDEAQLQRQLTYYDPWADLSHRHGVAVYWHAGDIAQFKMPLGATDFEELSITLLIGQHEAKLRSTLTHELIHLERGPVHVSREIAEERSVDLLTAKRLIDPAVFDFLSARRSEPTRAEICRTLRVDLDTFHTYRTWRKRVKPATVQAAWEEARQVPPWPPAWLREGANNYAEAARFADCSGATNKAARS